MRIKQSFDPGSETKAKVIAAATKLFASKGMENVFVRELTTVAGVNLAAVNYHFGTKEALCEAVLESVATSVNDRRLANLRALLVEASEKKKAPSLQAILETFMEPYLGPDTEGEGAVLAQLVIKDRISRNEMTHRIIRKHFDPLAREYIAAFAKACPHVDPSDFYWRYMLMYGSVVLASTDRSKENRLSTMSEGKVDASDAQALHAAVVDFLVPAISAPSRQPVQVPKKTVKGSDKRVAAKPRAMASTRSRA